MDQPTSTPDADLTPHLRQTLAAELPADALEPVLAGLRARRIADVCEREGLAAVLVDATGRVLHMASAARACLGPDLELVADHLIGRTGAVQASLQRALTAALSDGPPGDDGDAASEGARPMTGWPYRDSSPFQLLRGLLVLGAARPGETLQQLLPA